MHQAESKRCSLKPNPGRSAILGQVFVAVVPINFRGTDHAIPALKCDILSRTRREPSAGKAHEAAGITFLGGASAAGPQDFWRD